MEDEKMFKTSPGINDVEAVKAALGLVAAEINKGKIPEGGLFQSSEEIFKRIGVPVPKKPSVNHRLKIRLALGAPSNGDSN